jgi:hypothetical protein
LLAGIYGHNVELVVATFILLVLLNASALQLFPVFVTELVATSIVKDDHIAVFKDGHWADKFVNANQAVLLQDKILLAILADTAMP